MLTITLLLQISEFKITTDILQFQNTILNKITEFLIQKSTSLVQFAQVPVGAVAQTRSEFFHLLKIEKKKKKKKEKEKKEKSTVNSST